MAGARCGSGGLPSPDTLATLRSIEERDVRTPTAGRDDPFVGFIADLRGSQPDGRRFRFVGQMLETLYYEDASPDVAAYSTACSTRCAISNRSSTAPSPSGSDPPGTPPGVP